MTKLMVATFFLIISLNCFSNSCKIKLPVAEQAKTSDVAFIGRVLRKPMDFSLQNDKYVLSVITSQKGEISGEVIVWTSSPSDCGVILQKGQTYVIFGKFDKEQKIWTSRPSSWRVLPNNDDLTKDYLNNFGLAELPTVK